MIPKRSQPAGRSPWPTVILTMTLAIVAGGCGPTSRPADPGEGLKALRTALDAWKGGETLEALARRDPSIVVADGDWSSGHRLRDYRADGEGRRVGHDLNYSVALELKNPRGKIIKKEALYAVTTDPKVMVIRQDD